LKQNAIEAVIHETQNLVDGSIVKMRLLDDIAINSVTISRGNFVFGKASLEGERLHIDINSIRKDNSIFHVKLTTYDLDGMEGIHIPGAITRDVAKQSADNSLQNIEMNSIDPSFKVQATTAGINAAKSLLTKKAKLVKVTVKAGYKVLLKENQQ
jgi:conjugative transposon TraM protein